MFDYAGLSSWLERESDSQCENTTTNNKKQNNVQLLNKAFLQKDVRTVNLECK